MRTWAIGFIFGSFLCLAAVFVWVGLQSLDSDSAPAEAEKVETVTEEIAESDATSSQTPEATDDQDQVDVTEPVTTAAAVEDETPVLDTEVETETVAELDVDEDVDAEEVIKVEEQVVTETPVVDVEEPAEVETETVASTQENTQDAVTEETAPEAVVTEVEDAVVEAPSVEVEADTVAEAESVVEQQTEAPSATTVVDGQGIKLSEGGSSRLPKISDEPETAEVTETPVEIVEDEKPEIDTSLPKISIILVDQAEGGVAAADLALVSYPVTIAVSPARENIDDILSEYERSDHAILALSPTDVEYSLSGNLSDSQVSTLLSRYFAIMPKAIGMLDRPEATLQVDRQLAKAVVKSFAENGKALVTYSKGLNSLLKDAENAKVPAAKIFRSLDSKGEDQAAILRVLDRAVLEASQNGQAIVQGSSNAQTLAAIDKWLGTNRASTVTLVTLDKVLATP
jgi:polysaccharide deacetylase 2 family uncharacterized protein YibQ